MLIAFFQSFFIAPAVFVYLPEKIIAPHHLCAAGLMVFQVDEPTIPELF
jgi:hypothetical protein